MRKNTVAALRYKSHGVSRMKQHLAHRLKPSFRGLLFFLAVGMFLFSCDEKIDPSSEASITSLTLTVDGVDYAVTFTNKQGKITLPSGTELPATATVKAVVLSAKATGIKVGDKITLPASGTVTLTVTAEDNKTKVVYTLTVEKATPNSEASITALTLTVGSTDYEIDFTDRADTLTLPEGVALPTTVSVKTVSLSAGATSDAGNGNELAVTNNAVTITVTAEDGTTTQQYTVTFVVTQTEASLFTSFKFTPEDNEAMALEAADRKEIAGTINEETKEITFDEQSAYVYLNRLKASFTASAGATVQVGGSDQVSGVTEQDFTSSVSYVVRAQGGTETTYTVTLTKSKLATIPDAQLRAKLKELLPAAFIEDQPDITHSDVVNNSSLNLGNQTPELTSVKGIEFFTALTDLNCQSNDLASLDVSKNTALEILNCSTNSIPSLDMRANTALRELSCSNNALDSLDVSKNTDLNALRCDNNALTFLDMTGMRSVGFQGALNIGTGTDNPLETLRVNTALQDRQELITMKQNRGAALTVTTVDDAGTVVCTDYNPAAGGGSCGPLSNEASITALTLTVGDTDYEIAFTDRADTLTLPTGVALPTGVSVKTVTLSDGATGVVTGDERTVSDNVLTLTVTAEDGTTTQNYTVVFSAAANNEALIKTFTLNAGTENYPVQFTGTQASVRLPYGTPIPSTVGVVSAALSPGATGLVTGDELTVINNVVTITVTAEDGTTGQEYTVTFSAAVNTEALITALTLTAGAANYDVTFAGTQGSVILSYGTPMPTTVRVASAALSPGATGVVTGAALAVAENAVTLTVTAQDGTTTNTYTVSLAVSAGITSFIFEVTDNEGMALDPADRQRMVGSINHRDKTIAFSAQSAYVYRDKLKATFEVSEPGVAVQVGGVDQVSGFTEQDFTSSVSYVLRTRDGRETTYTITLSKRILAAIPDASFRVKLQQLFPSAFIGDQLDITNDAVVNNGGVLDVSDQNPKIASLKGIEFFTSLANLDCGSNALASLDVSKNTALARLDCGSNSLTALDVRANTALTRLDCDQNGGLASLDVRSNTALTGLYCYTNAIDFLDVSKNTALTNLYCGNNNIPSLDVSANTALATLYCQGNDLDSLDVSANTALTVLGCANNALKSLDVSRNTALEELYCDNNVLKSLDVRANTALTILNCNTNALTFLDMTGMRSVTLLDIGTGTGTDNLLETLRVNTALQDRAEIITMKTVRGAGLTITTVNDAGTVVCVGYSPLAGGGRCGPLSEETSITSLTFTVGTANYDVTFEGTQASVILPYGTAIPTTVRVASAVLSAGATGVAAGDVLTISDNAVTITVTAQDGTTTNTYTVSLAVSAGITSFIFEVTDNEGMALDETDRKRIMGTIDQKTGTITFPEQSAYVYLNRLKASFTASADATVQVGGVTHTSGVTEQDFSSPVSYVVRATDGTETTYTVTLTKSKLATIPDAQFRAKLKELFPEAFTEDQMDITHADVVNYNATLNVRGQTPKITSLKGIEFFTFLTNLDCGNNGLTSIDVSKNRRLRYFFCNDNALKSLDVSANTALLQFGCTKNALESLEVSANTALKALFCSENSLTYLDITGMRSISYPGALNIGTGTGTNNPLEILRVNTALQDDAALVAMKQNRGAGLTVTTVDNAGTVVCADYIPLAGGGSCGPPSNEASITSFTFEVADNENMALDEADRQRIEGTINQQDNTITFDEQSAYVYLNRLKASFTASAGAAVQVGGADQVSGTAEQDFSSPVSYIVRAADGTETTYTVTLTKSTMATIPDASFRAKLQEFVPAAFTEDQLDITHEALVNNDGELDLRSQTPKLASVKGVEFFTTLTLLNCNGNALESLDVSKNTALTELLCSNNRLTFLDMTGMRSIAYSGALSIGRMGTFLTTLRVNTVLQDNVEIGTVKSNRKEALTVTTVNNEGTVVCTDYVPSENPGGVGTCNDN